MNSLEFVKMMFDDKPENTFILIWQAMNKKSSWFQDTRSAADFITKNPEDIYFGVGLSPANYGPAKRCVANNIAGIPGLYVDVDIGQKSGKKYPDTFDDAVELITIDGLKPTMIVHSGNGIHGYWLFKEIWMFDTQEEREQAADLNLRLHLKIKERAIKKKWHIDSVFDLARILRPSGTLNCKSDPPKDVTVYMSNGQKYSDPDIFEEMLTPVGGYDITKSKLSKEDLKAVEKILRLKNIAEPPRDALDMLLEADVNFKAAWQQVKDNRKDTSTSGYHWDLCVYSIKAGWTDQEIANLLIAWNRRHGHDLNKVLRADYVARTIGNARHKVSGDLANEFSEEVKGIEQTSAAKPMQPALKKKCLEIISHHCGFKILRIIKYVQEDRMKYKVETADKGPIHFNGQDEMLSKAKFTQRVFSVTNIALSITTKDWVNIINTYKHIIDDVIVSAESSVEGRTETWLQEYLEGQQIRDQHEAALDDQPFVFQDHWYIFATKFKEWAYSKKHDRQSVAKTRTDLKNIGAMERRFNPNHPLKEGGRIKKMAWKIPHSIAKPA